MTHTPLTKVAERKELLRLHAATKHDQDWQAHKDFDDKWIIGVPLDGWTRYLSVCGDASKACAKLIVAARNALPRLLADLDAAEAERDEIKTALGVMGATRERALDVAGSQDALEERIDSMSRERDVALKGWSAAEAARDAAAAQRDRAESDLDAERRMRVEAEAASDRSNSELATAQSIVSQSTARMEEMRAERDALKAQEGEWADQIAAALNSTADKLGRTPSMIAGHVRREHEAHTACFGRLRKAVDERDALKKSLRLLDRITDGKEPSNGTEPEDIQQVVERFVALKAKLDDPRRVVIHETEVVATKEEIATLKARLADLSEADEELHTCRALVNATSENLSVDLERMVDDLAEANEKAVRSEKDSHSWHELYKDTKAKLAALVEESRSAETILGNMAKETGRVFGRWEINHEPLRNDAQRMLPSFRAAIAAARGGAPC